ADVHSSSLYRIPQRSPAREALQLPEPVHGMAFAQLAWASLRDIGTCRRAQASRPPRIGCRDPKRGRSLVFLTGNLDLPARTVADIHGSR
ncbi:MAG: hypothetical protein OXE82_07265, partial [Rhodobacter sp.]|nr:hypothetical protein [Rhodobacter sp.]